MITSVNTNQIEAIIKKDHPLWVDEAICSMAEKYISNLDSMLDEPLSHYLNSGVEDDFTYGEFSIKLIQAFRSCSYFDAIVIMNEYIKDPVKGKAKLLL